MKKHDCFHFEEEPAKRERPDWAGPADTTPVGQYWDVQHKPCPPVGQYWDAHHKPCPPVPDCGYGMPPLMPPIPPFNPNLSMPGQVEALNCKVNDLIKTLNCYSENVYGAYSAIVHSALCNDAYYREVTIEEGYIPDASAKYKVVHIPFLDKAGEPIYLELGLAYNNSTNSGVREKSFDASQRFLADKIIPATNVGTNWYGHPIWKNAPIPTTVVEGMKYTVGITEGGFIKWYANSVDDRTMQIDKVRNAMGVRSVLIAGGELSQNMWENTDSTQLARVGIGMNYQTKERFIVVVEGSDRTGCTIEQFANIFKGYECDVAVECANGDSSYMLDKGEMAVMPSTVNAMNIPTVPDSNCFWYITKRRHYKNQYVKDVAVLTQRVGQEIWNTELADTAVDKVKDEVIDLNNRLADEIQNRKDADEHLADLIADETDARIAGDEKLDNRITNEVATLNARIDSEVEKLNAVDAKLREDLTAETHNRIANDIASVELVQDGTKDIYRLKKNDGTAIEVPIELYNYTLLVQKLDTLSQVEVRLNAEIEARKAADDKIEAKVDTEIADRKTADADLQKQINDNKSSADAALAQEVADRKAADAQEVADRTQADADMDAALKALIKAEETARTAQDTVLANQIANLTKQYQDFKNATESDIAGIETDIEGLNTNLDNLVRIVSKNKTELEGKLTDLTARVTAEETTTADNVQKIAQITSQLNAMQETMSALNQTVTSLQASFASTEKSFENVKQTVANMQTELNIFEQTVNTKLKELSDKFGEYLPLTGSNVTITESGATAQFPITGPVMFDDTGINGIHTQMNVNVDGITSQAVDGTPNYLILSIEGIETARSTNGLGSSIKVAGPELSIRHTVNNSVIGFGLVPKERDGKTVLHHWCNKDVNLQTINQGVAVLANIGDGTDEHDAVNVKQLNTAKKELSDKFGGYLPLTGSNFNENTETAQFPLTGPVVMNLSDEEYKSNMLISPNGIFSKTVANDGTGSAIELSTELLKVVGSFNDSIAGFELQAIKRGDKTVINHSCQLGTKLNNLIPSKAILGNIEDGTDANDAVNVKQLNNVIGTYYDNLYAANLKSSLPAHKRIVFASHLINIDSSSALYGKTVISVLARFINNGDVMNSVDINTMVLTDPNVAGNQILLSFNAENLTDNDITRGSGSDTYIEFTIRYK